MKNEALTPKMKRQRKFLLVLPLIVLPFVTLLFVAMGGGKGSQANAAQPQGLNMSLPKSVLAGSPAGDKMGFYDQAQKDSIKLTEQRKSDPYTRKRGDTLASFGTSKFTGSPANSPQSDAPANERQIYQRLAALQQTVDKPVQPGAPAVSTVAAQPKPAQPAVSEDPELKQMSALLGQIMDIQHPERVKARTDTAAAAAAAEKFRAIPAVIDGKQKITDGTVIRIRLLDSVTLGGQFFPKGQLVFVSGNFYNQRLSLHIKSIRQGNQIFPVDLTVYDETDGLEGVCVPEALTSDAVKEGSADAVQGMQFLSMDQSMATQAASAGLNAAKGLFSKKVKRVKAKLKDGHRLLLRDNQKLRITANDHWQPGK